MFSLIPLISFLTECDGRTSRISSAKQGQSFVLMSPWGLIIDLVVTAPFSWLQLKKQDAQLTCSMDTPGRLALWKYDQTD